MGGGRFKLREGALREARRRRLWSAAELGRRAGVAESTVLRIEHGQQALPGTVRKLADALEVDPRELLEGTSENVPSRTLGERLGEDSLE